MTALLNSGYQSNAASQEHALGLLRTLTRNPDATFRDGQWTAIDAVVNRGERALLVQRTGWGKSAVYFISAQLLREQGLGPTVIVSPLLGLMRNQVQAARRGGLMIGALHSGTNKHFQKFADLVAGKQLDVLMISPERFANAKFQTELWPNLERHLGMFVVDEAHCISDWGHDFRPDYQRLQYVIANLPERTHVMATTATANNRVIEDVCKQLGKLQVIRGELHRTNLALQTTPTMNVAQRLAFLGDHLPKFPGQGIIYALTTRDTEQIAAWLQHLGLRAEAYHGQIGRQDETDATEARLLLENRFTSGDIDILVATSALGMGYDNPGVRYVIHFQSPGSVITYYQQVGRAGRGADSALGLMMSGPEDQEIHEFFWTNALPTVEDVTEVLDCIEMQPGGRIGVYDLSAAVNLSRGRLDGLLKYLASREEPTVRHEQGKWVRTATPLHAEYGRLRDAQVQRKQEDWSEISTYRQQSETCRMAFLLRKLDDPAPIERCGICDVCTGKPVVSMEYSRAMLQRATEFLNQTLYDVIEPRKKTPGIRLSSLNGKATIPDELQAEPGCVMSNWSSDSDLRHRIANGKRTGRYDDQVIQACVETIRQQWNPDPAPRWVTAVPSLRNPQTVPWVAQAIAIELGLEFVQCVHKVRETQQQKLMENSAHQIRNLDGAFEIVQPVPSGPVLLVDDMVDSRWTFTIIAMELRRAGSGPVFPFALVNTAKSSD